jgi:hypothetical protein
MDSKHPGVHVSRGRGALAPCSWTPQESEVESCKHQDDSNIHRQPFPESVSEEHEIYPDYDGYHRHHAKHDSYLPAHFSPWFNRKSIMLLVRIPPLKVPNFKLTYCCFFKKPLLAIRLLFKLNISNPSIEHI